MVTTTHTIYSRDEASDMLRYTLSRTKEDVLLLIAGGSVTDFFLPRLQLVQFAERLTITVTDERFTDSNTQHNFYQLTERRIIKDLEQAGAKFISTKLTRNDTDPEDLGLRFDYELENWINTHPHGKIVMLAGFGVDGHTLGVFPSSNEHEFRMRFVDTARYAVGYHAGDVLPTGLRVTTTLWFASQVHHCFIFYQGMEKKKLIESLVQSEVSTAQSPVQFLLNLPQAVLVEG